MSECRRRLWVAMTAVGLDKVLYVDTDSIIVADPESRSTEALDDASYGPEWHVKGEYTSLQITGPRNLVCNESRRVSGLPLSAIRTGEVEFSGQVMRSIKESMRNGQLDCIASVPRRFVMNAPDLRRQHLPRGQTEAFSVQLPTEPEEAIDG
jgi:hypothetical protein